ncbi:MAG TPA: universal stress protein, partial [Pseudonocardiaceae bacterium]
MENGRQRVVVGVNGSVGSLAALRRGVAEARSRDAVLHAVLAWTPPGGDGVGRRTPCPPVLLLDWQRDALRRLRTAWDDAMGGVPQDLDVRGLAIRGPAGEALLQVADQESDLLVVGGG